MSVPPSSLLPTKDMTMHFEERGKIDYNLGEKHADDTLWDRTKAKVAADAADLEAKQDRAATLNKAAAEKALTYVPEIETIKTPTGVFWKIPGGYLKPEVFVPVRFICDIRLSKDAGHYRVKFVPLGIPFIQGGMSTITLSMVSGVKHEIDIETTCADILLAHLREEWKKGGCGPVEARR